MRLKLVHFIALGLLITFFACERKSNSVVSDKSTNPTKEEVYTDITNNDANNDPRKKPIRKPKPTYICEVHFFDGNYEVLEALEDFKGEYSTVKRITIQNQGITKVPSNIHLFTQVELLDMSHNKMEDIDAAAFSKLPQLKKLYINANPITQTRIDNIKKELASIQIFSNEDFNK